MSGKSFFIDLTKCTACRGCQVACKQWNKLPAEQTRNHGSYQNPMDVSAITYKSVHMKEVADDQGFMAAWLFFPEQCRHCYSAPCKDKADETTSDAILHDAETGAVVFTKSIKGVSGAEVRAACPYDIPRAAKDDNGASKCDFCFDRITNGRKPSCVLACPTGTMNYGEEEDMLALAHARLKEVRREFPKAYLGDPGNVRVIYLYQTDHRLYYQDTVGEKVAEAAPTLSRRDLLAEVLGKKA